MSKIMGEGDFQYIAQDGWAKWPEGWDTGDVAAVGVDKHDNVYAFNRGPHPMVVFDRDGNFLRSWGEGIFKNPHGVFMGLDDTIFLNDDGDHTMRQCTLDGKVLGVIGRSGRQLGQFSGAHQLACPSENEIYAAETANWRVQKLTTKGTTSSAAKPAAGGAAK